MPLIDVVLPVLVVVLVVNVSGCGGGGGGSHSLILREFKGGEKKWQAPADVRHALGACVREIAAATAAAAAAAAEW